MGFLVNAEFHGGPSAIHLGRKGQRWRYEHFRHSPRAPRRLPMVKGFEANFYNAENKIIISGTQMEYTKVVGQQVAGRTQFSHVLLSNLPLETNRQAQVTFDDQRKQQKTGLNTNISIISDLKYLNL